MQAEVEYTGLGGSQYNKDFHVGEEFVSRYSLGIVRSSKSLDVFFGYTLLTTSTGEYKLMSSNGNSFLEYSATDHSQRVFILRWYVET